MAAWTELSTPPAPPPGRPLLSLPEPAQRYLRHAISPAAAPAHAVVLEMTGHIRVGRWLPFRAVQLHAPPRGYVWAARAGWPPLSISGFDSYEAGDGRMHWALGGRLPVMRASGPDVSRSAAGRLALDAIFVPSALLTADWDAGGGPDTAVAGWTLGGESEAVEITIVGDGRVTSVCMQRWGNPVGRPYGRYPCGGIVDAEATFDGYTIPSVIRAGWFVRSAEWEKGEFFRARITGATFLPFKAGGLPG